MSPLENAASIIGPEVRESVPTAALSASDPTAMPIAHASSGVISRLTTPLTPEEPKRPIDSLGTRIRVHDYIMFLGGETRGRYGTPRQRSYASGDVIGTGESMRVCSKCGKQAGDRDIVCSFCGGSLGLGDADHPHGLDAGAPTPTDDVKSAVESRRATDVRLSPAWALISLLLLAPTTGLIGLNLLVLVLRALGVHVHLGGTTLYVLGLPLVGTAVFAVLFGLLTNKMLDRLNRHIDREERLRAALMSYVRSEARRSGGEQGIMDDLLRLSAFDGQATTYEKKLDPSLWGWGIFLVFIAGPLAMCVYYVLALSSSFEDFHYLIALTILGGAASLVMLVSLVMTLILTSHLMRTVATHEQRWYGFAGAFQAAMSLVSKDIEMPIPEKPLKERSVMLYVGLTIVTFGLFAIYWLYVLIMDPNSHFEHQHRTEDAILAAL